ncbi:MAG: LuxR C-terminal-related transcriptional regulator [Hyphomicrobiales bacterium]
MSHLLDVFDLALLPITAACNGRYKRKIHRSICAIGCEQILECILRYLGKNNQLTFLNSIHEAETSDEVWEFAASYFNELGFDKLTYVYIRLDAPSDEPVTFTTLPMWWSDTYLHPDNLAGDPLFRFFRSFGMKKTGAAYLDTYPPLTQDESMRVRLAGEAGCLTGFASPVKLIGNRRCGGWNFGSSSSRSAFEQIPSELATFVQLMGFYAHERIETLSNIRNSRMAVQQSTQILSGREQECLGFLATGSRTSSIAKVLGISAATVEFHFKNIKRKLGASTREEALVKAIKLGQIAIFP